MSKQQYALICPDTNCEHEFTHEADPEELAKGGGDLITCPECQEEWEWEFDADEDPALILVEQLQEDDDEYELEDDEDDEDDFVDPNEAIADEEEEED